MTWQQMPFVRLVFPLIIGISSYLYLGAELLGNIPFLGLMFLFLGLLAAYFYREPSIRFVRFWGLGSFFILILLGYSLTYFNDAQNNPLDISKIEKQNLWVATICSPTKLNPKSIKATLSLNYGLDSNQNKSPIKGKIIAYFAIDTNSIALKYGHQIVFQSAINPIESPRNPYAFDARSYYHPKQIYHQTYIPKQHWEIIKKDQGHWLQYALIVARNRLQKKLKKAIKGPNELAVASALILGAKTDLSKEIKNAYADTGAMHVLAVSGLHVGIIIGLLMGLLSRIGLQYHKKTKAFILLLALWSFAFLTGASASVLRASTMFSFVIVGQAFYREINIYNSLAASAFILLCINPFFLQDIGFQLSYFALLGIVYYHPIIYKAIYFDNKWLNWIWNGLAISLAAQLSTLPISLFYFHQFPLFFWLTGVIITAAASIILSLGVALLALDWLPYVGEVLGTILDNSLWLMNSLIFVIQQLPGAVLEGFWLAKWEMWLWYLVLLSTTYLFYKRQLRIAFFPLFLLLGLASFRAYTIFQQTQQKLFVCYHLRKNTLFAMVEGQRMYTFGNTNTLESLAKDYAQKNQLFALGIQQNYTYSLDSNEVVSNSFFCKNGLVEIADTRIFVLNKTYEKLSSLNPLAVDYVLLSNNPKIKNIAQINELCHYKTLLIDGSNSYWNSQKWIKECQKLDIPYIDIAQEGAFIQNIALDSIPIPRHTAL